MPTVVQRRTLNEVPLKQKGLELPLRPLDLGQELIGLVALQQAMLDQDLA